MYGDRGYGDRGGFKSFSPVKVGDELDVKIEAVGEKGDGIAKKDGFVLFVPNTKEGQEVRIRVTKVLRKVGFAEVVGEGSGSGGAGQSEEEPAAEDTEDFGEEPGSDEEAPEAPEEEKEQAEESDDSSEKDSEEKE